MSEQKTSVCQKPFKVFVSKNDMLEDEINTLKSELEEMRSVLAWAGENVTLIQRAYSSGGKGWSVGSGVTMYKPLPTLYEALKSAWEAREK